MIAELKQNLEVLEAEVLKLKNDPRVALWVKAQKQEIQHLRNKLRIFELRQTSPALSVAFAMGTAQGWDYTQCLEFAILQLVAEKKND